MSITRDGEKDMEAGESKKEDHFLNLNIIKEGGELWSIF